MFFKVTSGLKQISSPSTRPQVVPCMVTENKLFYARGFCTDGIQRNVKAHVTESCLRMKVPVPPTSHRLVRAFILPSPTDLHKPQGNLTVFQGRFSVPHEAAGEEMSTFPVSPTQPRDGQTLGVD